MFLIFLIVMPVMAVVNLSGVLLAIDNTAGVSVALAVRCVVVCTAMIICAAATRSLLRYALAVIEYVPGLDHVKLIV